jgi:hypothetical protein
VSDEAPRRWFERGGGQGTVQVRLMEPDDPMSCRGHVVAQPAEGQLVAGGEQHQRVGTAMPVADDTGMGEGELKCGMGGLTGLGPRRQIGADDQIEAVQAVVMALTVRHNDQHTGPAQPLSHRGTGWNAPMVCMTRARCPPRLGRRPVSWSVPIRSRNWYVRT